MTGKFTARKKAVCCAALLLAVAGGFMGIDRFKPDERTVMIIDDCAAVSESAAVSDTGNKLSVNAKAAVLIDGNSGRVLYSKNPYKHLPPASVTKVMTLLLIMEGCESGKISLDDRVAVSKRAAGMGGSQMYMEQGEKHTVGELLKGVIMVSANDGCVALAEHLCGSVEEFVDAMNARAAKMGLKNSNFANTNGLPVANHYSCAYDIGMISKELLKHDRAHKWFTAWQEDIRVGLPGKKSKFTLTNTNRLIKNYSGAIGVKTGFTQDAGYCLSGAADRNSTRMICVVLGCKTSDIRFEQTAKLLDYGFANYETVKIAEAGKKIQSVKISKGDKARIFAVVKKDISLTVRKGGSGQIKKKIMIDKEIKAPIRKGERVGFLTVYEGKSPAGRYDLTADRDVKKAGLMTIYIRMIKKLA